MRGSATFIGVAGGGGGTGGAVPGSGRVGGDSPAFTAVGDALEELTTKELGGALVDGGSFFFSSLIVSRSTVSALHVPLSEAIVEPGCDSVQTI